MASERFLSALKAQTEGWPASWMPLMLWELSVAGLRYRAVLEAHAG